MTNRNEKLKEPDKDFDKEFEKSFISFKESPNKSLNKNSLNKNNKENIIFFPVRHHSPACSYHLEKIIEKFKPASVLIEGPSDCNNLIEYMIEEDTVPPFCIYSSYIDKNGEKLRCYYPFLDYSPEFTAIKKANELKINSYFIDMPFGSLIENSNNSKNNKKINSIYDKDNNKFNVNDYTMELTRKSGLRSFAELWERDFEIKGILKKSEDFIKSAYALGYYMRLIEKEDIETQNREYFMAKNIMKELKKIGKNDKILVITGSFHIKGIIEKLDRLDKLDKSKKNNSEYENLEDLLENLKKYNISNSSNYLIPYSFEEADQRKGYIAGIEYPAFYHNVWKRLKENSKENRIENAYIDTVQSFIIKAASINRDYYNINISDCINAYYMSVNLAKLRGKDSAGVYELIDAVQSAFVKGEISLENTENIELMKKLLSGIANGKVSSKTVMPPVVLDFRNLCKIHRIRIDKSEKTESILDIIKDKNHFEKSKFFHRIRFLDIGFCKLLKGPDYINKIDKNLAREIWRYKYQSQVEASLIDKSVYGTNIEELCVNFIKDKLKNRLNSEELSKLIIESETMGLYDFLIDNYEEIENIILSDSDFVSLCKCLNNLSYLINMKIINENINKDKINKIDKKIDSKIDKKENFTIPLIESLLKRVFISASENMEYLKNFDEEKALKYSIYIKNLYIFILENQNYKEIKEFKEIKEIFEEKIDSMLENTFGSSHIYAVCLAIKYKLGKINIKEFASHISNFLEASDSNIAAYFLNGIFLIAKDILFINDNLIKEIDKIIKNIEEDKFIEILPNLRYAFTNLTPSETERLSLIIAKLYKKINIKLSNITEEEIEKASILDKKIAKEMRKYEIFN